MPRLDAERVALWRRLDATVSVVRRRLDALLVEEFDLPLAWFEVLAALYRAGGTMRVSHLNLELDDVASSLSRRLDRMEQEGYVERSPSTDPADRRAVTVRLTRDGRLLWRDANVAYRRGVQLWFNQMVTDTDLQTMSRLISKLGH